MLAEQSSVPRTSYIVQQNEHRPGHLRDARTVRYAANTPQEDPLRALTGAEGFLLAAILLAMGATAALLYLLSWQFRFEPATDSLDYWMEAGNQVRNATWLGGAAAMAAGACCLGSLAVPHRLRTSGWAIIVLSVSGLLLGADVLVGTGTADMAHRVITLP